MVEVELEETIHCSPQMWCDFVLDVHRYAAVDDKIGPITWVRRRGDLVEFKFRPLLPGFRLTMPRIVAQMWLTQGSRIDVRLAPLPRNLTSRLASRFSASFSWTPQNGGVRVRRAIAFHVTPPLRWRVEPVLRRALPASVRRELELSKAILENGRL